MYIIRDHCAELIGVDLFPKYVAPKTEIKEEDEDEDKYDVSCSLLMTYFYQLVKLFMFLVFKFDEKTS